MALPLRPSEFSLCLGYKHKQPAAPNPKITEFRENKKLTGQGGTTKALSGTLFILFFFFFFLLLSHSQAFIAPYCLPDTVVCHSGCIGAQKKMCSLPTVLNK